MNRTLVFIALYPPSNSTEIFSVLFCVLFFFKFSSKNVYKYIFLKKGEVHSFFMCLRRFWFVCCCFCIPNITDRQLSVKFGRFFSFRSDITYFLRPRITFIILIQFWILKKKATLRFIS